MDHASRNVVLLNAVQSPEELECLDAHEGSQSMHSLCFPLACSSCSEMTSWIIRVNDVVLLTAVQPPEELECARVPISP
jgi:hypothetical protein